MLHPTAKLLLVAMATVVFVSAASLSSGASDLLTQAAQRFRDKDYSGAAELARKADNSPQRTFLLGTASLRLGKADEALPLLSEAEAKLPLAVGPLTSTDRDTPLRLPDLWVITKKGGIFSGGMLFVTPGFVSRGPSAVSFTTRMESGREAKVPSPS